MSLLKDSEHFARQLDKYASSGAEDDFDQLHRYCSELQDARVVVDDIRSRHVLQLCLAKFVNDMQLPHLRRRRWQCIFFLTSAKFSRGAERVLKDFSECAECRQLLDSCATALRNDDDQQILYCVGFLGNFMFRDEVRQKIVFHCPNLREALYGYLEERFVRSSCDTQMWALSAAVNMSRLFVTSDADHETFLRSGALRAVKCAAMHVFSCNVPRGDTEISRINQAMVALDTTLHVVRCVPSERRVHLDVETYKLSRKEMRLINVTTYSLLSSIWADSWLHHVSAFLRGYGTYLRVVFGPDALQSFLMYKPPRDVNAKPIALLLAECVIDFGQAFQEFETMRVLRRFAQAVPQVADILLWLPSAPTRVVKDRRCAKPGCSVSGEGLYNTPPKCGRCKAVYYCCKRHQIQHWSEHRRTCVKVGTSTQVSEGVVGAVSPAT
jgi:hypothetical protein